jgi:hypothetical protein
MVLKALVLSLLAATAHAAVPPQQVTWVQPNVEPVVAQAFVYTLTISEEGNSTPRVVPFLSVLCGGSGTTAECSTPLPVNAQSAIITGNVSRITATDTRTNLSSPASAPFTGNQGCIFRDNLYAVSRQTTVQTNKPNLQRTLDEFQRAKFKHLSTTPKGGQFLVTEECVGYLVK